MSTFMASTIRSVLFSQAVAKRLVLCCDICRNNYW